MVDLFSSIAKVIKKEHGNNLHTINDLFYVCKNEFLNQRPKQGLYYCKELKKIVDKLMVDSQCQSNIKVHLADKLSFDILVLESRYSLDSYFQALEFGRPLEEQFYMPRRNTLIKHGVVQALEDLIINDTLDELFLSMPPRVGKSTLIVYLMTWLLGYEPNRTNLYCSNSGTLTQTFYAGIHTILTDNFTYKWKEIFPNIKFDSRSMCSAKDTYLDTDKPKRFHSFTARSIDGSLNGACDCDRLLVADDLVNGIEEALNQQRLRSLWLKTNNDLLSRAKQKAKILWIGTRWSILDPIGIRLESKDLQDKRYKNIVIPALDENDRSNFNYLHHVGFDTKFYKSKRLSFEESDDIASWNAQYMNAPVERSGLLFPIESLNYYNGVLPDTQPTRKFAFVDVAWGGGDYLVMPIIYQYETSLYCVDFICDNNNKKITQPRVVDKIIQHDLGTVKFEKNNGGDGYKDDIQRLLDQKGIKINILSAFASNQMAKETKIFEHAPEIKEIYFLDSDIRSVEYNKAMQNLTSFTIKGKNRHDDVPDALAEICVMANEVVKKVSFEIFERFF